MSKKMNEITKSFGYSLFVIISVLLISPPISEVSKDSLNELSLNELKKQFSIDNNYEIVLADLNIQLEDLINVNHWGRNPFLPYQTLSKNEVPGINLIASEDQNDVFVLEKIFWTKNGKKAIINHRTVSKGDLLNRYHVIYIGESIVVVKSMDDYFLLSLEK